MTRKTALVCGFGIAGILAAGCGKKKEDKTPAPGSGAVADPAGSAGSAATPPPAPEQKLEGQLNIIAWPGYIERGESDKAYDWVTQYEKDTGCKVNVKTAATSDEMVALMGQGGYDLVTARFADGGTAHELNRWFSPQQAARDIERPGRLAS